MDWGLVFAAINWLALIAWVVLIVLPRSPLALSCILYLGVGVLCLVYTASLGAVLTGLVQTGGEGGADFSTIEGVRAIFSSDAGVTIGWAHYLAFDLFVGLWIARDADAKTISRFIQAPILLMTLFAGPAGLFVWLVLREPFARTKPRAKVN